jgi:hypothetical protein
MSTFNEKDQRTATTKRDSASMKIDSPQSAHEQQAESVAEHAARNGQIMGSGDAVNGQVAGNPDARQGMIAPAGIKQQIAASKGNGDKLPDSATHMLKGKTGDIDQVRIHTDSKAAELADAVNAEAFTVGKDIYFSQGAFNTYTPEGKKLLIHELQHTAQNKEDNTEVIQRGIKVPTAWGEFEEGWQIEGKNTDNGEKYPLYGFGGVLTYTPKDPTDATSIGLVQIARGHENDVKKGDNILYDEETRKEHAIKAEDAKFSSALNENEEGFHVDAFGSAVNPLYAVTSAKEGETLTQGKTDKPVEEKGGKDKYWEGAGQHGWHYKENNDLKHRPANIFDAPNFSITKGNTGGIVLETAAVALDGKQKGRYYGSVTWGWSVDAAGTLTTNHIKLASMGAVTPTFMKAAHMWNAGTSSKGKATIDLPTQEFYSLPADTDFYPGAEFSAGGKVTITTPSRFETEATDKTAPESPPDLVYVRVVDGERAGETGWISKSAITLEDNVPASLKGKN